MRVQFNEEFKEQAVQKVLNRSDGVRIEEIATSLGVSMSTLSRCTTSFRRKPL
jgi:transposase-like protein